MLITPGAVFRLEGLARCRLHLDVCAQQPGNLPRRCEVGHPVDGRTVLLRATALEIEPPRIDGVAAEEDACGAVEHHHVRRVMPRRRHDIDDTAPEVERAVSAGQSPIAKKLATSV